MSEILMKKSDEKRSRDLKIDIYMSIIKYIRIMLQITAIVK